MPTSSRSTKRRRPARRIALPRLNPEQRRRLVGVVLLLGGVGTALSLLFPEGPATWSVSLVLRSTAGWGAMAIPVVLLWVGGVTLRLGLPSGFVLQRSRAAGALVLLLSFLGLLHFLPLGEVDPALRVGLGEGGGYLGYLVGGLLLKANLGMLGSLLVLVAGFVVGTALVGRLHPRLLLVLLRFVRLKLRAWWAERRRRVTINQALESNAAKPKQPPRPQSRGTQAEEKSEDSVPSAAAPRTSGNGKHQWQLPPIDIFESMPEEELSQVDIKQRIRVIEETLLSFGVDARVVEVNQGPAVTQFGVEPGVGVKVARIMALANDLALRLAAAPLRLEAPVPGKQVVGIEVPNSSVSVVAIRDLLEGQGFKKNRGRLKLALGRDVSGAPVYADLTRMPHLLIAGATGSGKSVCLNSFISALLFECTPDDLRLLMIDPKMVELVPFSGVPHLLTPVVTDMERVVPSLKWVSQEMERRYRQFAARGCRNIEGYNRAASGKGEDQLLPYIVVVIDELADLMMTSPDEVEKLLCRLAQLARATGIHLVVATQRPSVDVVTGLIKANFPTRISFAVTSQIDSRVILDQAGAEKLLGRGDMLYAPTDSMKPMRLQGTYVSDGEILELVDYWRKARPESYSGALPDGTSFEPVVEDETDDLYDQAVELAEDNVRLSASFLQRRLRIGYNRAARLMEQLERDGVLPARDDGRQRDALVRSESSADASSEEPDPKP